MSTDSTERVAFETPRGSIVSGRVVDSWMEASAEEGPRDILRIRVPSGATYRIPATNTEAHE